MFCLIQECYPCHRSALGLSIHCDPMPDRQRWFRDRCDLLAFITCDLWFNSESHPAEIKPQLYRANSNDTAWLVTAPWEQLALVTDHRFHWSLLSGWPIAAENYRRHNTRYPAGLSSGEKLAEYVWLGRVGRTCRSFLLTVFVFGGVGFCNLTRSHFGTY